MRRIAVVGLLIVASATVTARESKLSDAEGGSCRGARSVSTRAPDRDPAILPAPLVKKAKPLPSNTGGGGDDVRLQSPRWHRFLPGMFR
jgi:hypothetical protein